MEGKSRNMTILVPISLFLSSSLLSLGALGVLGVLGGSKNRLCNPPAAAGERFASATRR